VAGGTAGATGSVMLNPGTAGEKPLPKIDVLALEPGDVLSVRTPGGGGHGDRFTRPPSHVLADVLSGLVSRERARESYGVVLDGDRVDEEATASLRAAQSDRGPAGASTGAVFDFGTARREHEQRWPSELQDAFIAMLMSLPAPYRAYVRRTLYGRVEALATERAVTADDLHRLLNELRASIALK
jgi:N-methylhydantoinase B